MYIILTWQRSDSKILTLRYIQPRYLLRWEAMAPLKF